MAMDLAAINPLLKDEYEDYVAELVHTETTALDLFTEGDTESADGRRVVRTKPCRGCSSVSPCVGPPAKRSRG